jgi:hypothetical protein
MEMSPRVTEGELMPSPARMISAGGGLLEQEAGRPGLQGAQDELVGAEGGED